MGKGVPHIPWERYRCLTAPEKAAPALWVDLWFTSRAKAHGPGHQETPNHVALASVCLIPFRRNATSQTPRMRVAPTVVRRRCCLRVGVTERLSVCVAQEVVLGCNVVRPLVLRAPTLVRMRFLLMAQWVADRCRCHPGRLRRCCISHHQRHTGNWPFLFRPLLLFPELRIFCWYCCGHE